MEETKLLNGRLIVITGDITEMTTDAIVNAANSSLRGGGGVDGAIHSKGGPSILTECKEIRKNLYPDGLPTGDAVVTGAGKLLCYYIIHTVGPVWHGGNAGEAEKLYRCYKSSLEETNKLNLKTVAFPSISTGVYGYPKQNAARVAFNAVHDFLSSYELPETVYFVFFSHGDTETFIRSVGIED